MELGLLYGIRHRGSADEYLHTVYEPDCEFVDGEVIERNVGEYPHSRLQGLLYAIFGATEEVGIAANY